jgi:hypothetical protein
MSGTVKVFREDKDSGHLVPVPQVARPQAQLPEVVKALRSFAEQAAVEDRCLLTPAQAARLVEAVGQVAEVDELRADRDRLLAERMTLEAQLAAQREYDERPTPQGVQLIVHSGGQVITYALATGVPRFAGGSPVDEPGHSIGRALLEVALTEWAGMGRPATQAGQSSP